MGEYRVTALYYRFTSETDHDTFVNATPWSGLLGAFDCALSDGVLKAIPTGEFRDRETAKEALEAHLHTWEQEAFLSPSTYRIRFEYERSDVEEVDPQPGNTTIFVEAIGVTASGFAPTITRGNRAYPSFDSLFVRTPITDLLTKRLRRTRDGGETWPAFAYFALSTIEEEFGTGGGIARRNAAKALVVDWAVLDALGRICDRRDRDIGRKAARNPAPIAASERAWMEVVVVRLIRRVGEHAAGNLLAPITMADLPPLA